MDKKYIKLGFMNFDKEFKLEVGAERSIDFAESLAEFLNHLSDKETSYSLQINYSPSVVNPDKIISDRELIDKLQKEYESKNSVGSLHPSV